MCMSEYAFIIHTLKLVVQVVHISDEAVVR